MYQSGSELYKTILNSDSISEALTHLRYISNEYVGCEHLFIMLSDGKKFNDISIVDFINIADDMAGNLIDFEQKHKFFSSKVVESLYYEVCTAKERSGSKTPRFVVDLVKKSEFSSMYAFNMENSFSNGILFFLFKDKSLSPGEIETCLLISSHMKQLAEKITFRKQIIKNSRYENLFNTLRMKDPYTVSHSYNVSFYASLLGEKLGLNENEIETLKLGAFLHDIGKVAIPDSILFKPALLTKEEFKLVEQHPLIGYELLKDLPDVEALLPIVKWHHERIDGQGYPDRLHMDQIPFMVRIVTLTDAFDAMTSQRVYQKNLNVDEAKKQLLQHANSQFDMNMVYPFLDIIENQAKLLIPTIGNEVK
jgi:HD-GYP domain-containing protein (c-di-GMP phosphodiesterase class II)